MVNYSKRNVSIPKQSASMENDKTTLKWACRMLETVSMEIFAKYGLLSSNRLGA